MDRTEDINITHPVADAAPGNWVDHYAPAPLQPYLRLIRADRPVGVWLLLWPCWWSVALAGVKAGHAAPSPWLLFLFAAGAFVMRGAGCIYNDIADRDYDARVARTMSRPIPSGQVSVSAAIVFMLALCFAGLAVLLQFNWFTVGLGIASLALVAVYPFMKRLTNWPQAVLGLAFAWGALMGWAAVFASLDWPPFFLYAAAIAWIIGYDTIYAHQDKEDDALLGLGSTALRFGKTTKRWLTLFYGAVLAFLLAAGYAAGAGWVYFAGLAMGGGHFVWQIATLDIDDPANCLKRFRSNAGFGALIFIAMAAGLLISPP